MIRPVRCCLLVAATLGLGCVKEISSNERLDRATEKTPLAQSLGAAELEKIQCNDTADELRQARNENGPETERVAKYVRLYQSLATRAATFDEAMSRNPDLAYRQGSEKLIAARDLCVQQVADVRLELERYVRELVALPTVKEIKGGKTVTVVRLDFPTLKNAIDVLRLDDRELLVSKLEKAEQKLKPR